MANSVVTKRENREHFRGEGRGSNDMLDDFRNFYTTALEAAWNLPRFQDNLRSGPLSDFPMLPANLGTSSAATVSSGPCLVLADSTFAYLLLPLKPLLASLKTEPTDIPANVKERLTDEMICNLPINIFALDLPAPAPPREAHPMGTGYQVFSGELTIEAYTSQRAKPRLFNIGILADMSYFEPAAKATLNDMRSLSRKQDLPVWFMNVRTKLESASLSPWIVYFFQE
ncbi:MAG: hypothetical protein M1829_000441 [Trizodia sp. TS-e1964]|nr:MAG: hypothetical protein M1829_000441 [Trizodia sp. TS-e1964]